MNPDRLYPKTMDSLLLRATGAQGYYGVFCANMHTDDSASAGSDAIIASALALQIPVVSSKANARLAGCKKQFYILRIIHGQMARWALQ